MISVIAYTSRAYAEKENSLGDSLLKYSIGWRFWSNMALIAEDEEAVLIL